MHRLDEYLTVADAAVFLGVSKDTLRRWDKAGKLRARRHPVTGYPTCRDAKTIKPENLVKYKSAPEGKRLHKGCPR